MDHLKEIPTFVADHWNDSIDGYVAYNKVHAIIVHVV